MTMERILGTAGKTGADTLRSPLLPLASGATTMDFSRPRQQGCALGPQGAGKAVAGPDLRLTQSRIPQELAEAPGSADFLALEEGVQIST